MATPLALEGDGLVPNLFQYLWTKDDFGAGPAVHVPHTVVFRASQPSAWYFTSRKTGTLQKKNKANLTPLQIENALTKRSSGGANINNSATDIVACYLYQQPGSTSPDTEVDDTIIEYLDADALHQLLFARPDKPPNGLLQRFVLPKGTHNSTIRAIWSPKICLLERRVNTKSLFDPRFTVYERGVTFDGGGAGELFSKPDPVRGAMLPGEVQRLCEQLVDHVTTVSYHKFRISRMVLHLKTDADDRLWLLWCSSLRLLQLHTTASAIARPLDIVADAHVPAHVSLGNVSHNTGLGSPSINRSKAIDRDAPLREGFQRCTSCADVVDQRRMLTTTYKAVLEHFQKFLLFLRLSVNEQEQVAIVWPPEQKLIDAAGGVGFGILPYCERSSGQSPSKPGAHIAGLNAKELIIPPVIQFLHPTLAVDDFERHRHDPIFLHKPVAVCERCCLVYSDYSTSALEANSLRPNVPAILRPQRYVNDLKRRLDPIDPVTIASPAAKPSSTAWRPIPKSVVASDKVPTRSASMSNLPRSTLHSLPPAPTLPDRIDSLARFIGVASSTNERRDEIAEGTGGYRQQSDELFFREMYHQHGVGVGDGHPLLHMLDSADQLAADASIKKKQLAAIHKSCANDGGSLSWSSTLGKSASMSALDQEVSNKVRKNPYSIVQKLAASKRGKQKHQPHQKPRARDSKVREHPADSESSDGEEQRASQTSPSPTKAKRSNNASSGRFISSREAQASESHQQFLFAALHNAQLQLDQIASLASIVRPSDEPHSLDPIDSPTIAELQSMLSENASLDAQFPR